jgi:hypothetical protein
VLIKEPAQLLSRTNCTRLHFWCVLPARYMLNWHSKSTVCNSTDALLRPGGSPDFGKNLQGALPRSKIKEVTSSLNSHFSLELTQFRKSVLDNAVLYPFFV